jgi:trans-aconitate methyltransferase
VDAVALAYDRIASDWCEARATAAAATFRERPWLDRLVHPLPAGARILDVGCGCGHPITADLIARGFTVVGLDASPRMLELARAAVPGTRFVLGDMRTADPGGPFAAVVAWDSVFHLPRDEHLNMFTRLRTWLVPGGRLLLSLGGSPAAALHAEMLGERFFYSAFAPAKALRLLEDAGFRVERWEVDDPSSHGHIAVLAVTPTG